MPFSGPTYDPHDNYWTVAGEVSRAWSSKSRGYVPASDGGFAAWLSAGNFPTPIASEADLAAALAPPGLYFTLADQLTAYARSAWVALLAKGQAFQVAPQGSAPLMVLCDGTNETRADLALLALFGTANPTGTKTWVDNDGHATVLTGAELVTLSTLAGDWIADTYPALATLLGKIAAGTVATFAAVDAYAWPAN